MRIRLLLWVIIPLIFSFSCGKKKSSTSTSTAAPVATEKSAGVTPFATGATSLAMAGKLALSATALTSQLPDKVLAVPFVQGTVTAYGDIMNYSDIKTLVVDATTGRFTVDLPLVDPYIAVIDSILADTPVTQAKVFAGIPFAMAISFISVADADLSAALTEYKSKLVAGQGRTWMLVAYNSTGTLVEQAASMHFIGMPTTSSDLRIIVPSLLKGDLELGSVTINSTSNASSTLKADSTVLNLSASAISELAWVSESLKSMKNAFMNVDLTAKKIIMPVIMFYWQGTGLKAAGSFTDPSTAVYQGYNPRVTAGNFPGMTSAGICGSTAGRIKLYPPSDITVTVSGKTLTMGPNAPFHSEQTSDYDSDQNSCSNNAAGATNSTSPTFWADFFDSGSGGGSRMVAEMEWSGSVQGKVPDGLWTVKYDSDTVAQFDMSSAAPVDANSITHVYVPSIGFEADADGTITAMVVKLNYQSSDGVWHEVSDITAASKFVSTIEMGFGMGNSLLGDGGGDTSSEKLMVQAGTTGFRVTSSSFKNTGWKMPGSTGDKIINYGRASFDLFGQKYSFIYSAQ